MRMLIGLAALGLTAGVGWTDEAVLWPAPSVVKVFRDDAPRDVGQPSRMWAAANEYECAQVVITAGDGALRNVSVSATALKGPATIAARHVRLFLPHYVPCPSAGKDYPDPLPPLRGTFDIEAGGTQPVWVEVKVPKGARAGTYRGEAIVRTGERVLGEQEIVLTVYPFELPDEVHVVTTTGLSMPHVYDQHGVAADEREGFAGRRLHRRYYEFMLEHKVSPYYLPVDIRSPFARKYLEDPRLTSFVIPFREDASYLRETAEYLQERGWLDKSYLYVVDEPITQDQYDRIEQVAGLIHQADPGLRLVAPFYRAPDFDAAATTFDELTGSLDIWCPNIYYFDLNPLVFDQIKERQRTLEDGWCYVCCGPGAPYNNFFVQMDGFSHRLLYTQLWRLGLTGLLYWSSTYWAAIEDPWESMTTVPDINEDIYGDGSLLYPGRRVGIDGPVGSVRLKIIRDGIEDYEYLRLLSEKRGPVAAQRAAEALCPSLTEYTRDAAVLQWVRGKVAREIAE